MFIYPLGERSISDDELALSYRGIQSESSKDFAESIVYNLLNNLTFWNNTNQFTISYEFDETVNCHFEEALVNNAKEIPDTVTQYFKLCDCYWDLEEDPWEEKYVNQYVTMGRSSNYNPNHRVSFFK